MPPDSLNELCNDCAATYMSLDRVGCGEKMDIMLRWQKASLWPPEDWASYKTFKDAARDLLQRKLGLSVVNE